MSYQCNTQGTVCSVCTRVVGLFTFVSALLLYRGSIAASRHLHQGILHNVLFSPMSFFDTTPSGRTLNRLSKDVDVIDNTIAMNFRMVIMSFLSVLNLPIVLGMSTPIVLVVIVPVAIIYVLTQVGKTRDKNW